MRINIVVAMSRNAIIGRDGGLPWRLPADLRHFKSVTMGNPIIMGRKTHESIGRELPGRLNIVVSKQADFRAPGCRVAHSLNAALEAAGAAGEVMIVGGAALYAEALARTERIYLTEVHAALDGDTEFPPIDWTEWSETDRQSYTADDKNKHDYSFVVLDRIEPPRPDGARALP
ncbi:MAG: dihydrofolate reductase [Gammaproteobacteria bacterium]|jgi:dihydrofolate reductase|nr:dihydrofolate reductase [Gammaproteobacteria bacterium]